MFFFYTINVYTKFLQGTEYLKAQALKFIIFLNFSWLPLKINPKYSKYPFPSVLFLSWNNKHKNVLAVTWIRGGDHWLTGETQTDYYSDILLYYTNTDFQFVFLPSVFLLVITCLHKYIWKKTTMVCLCHIYLPNVPLWSSNCSFAPYFLENKV